MVFISHHLEFHLNSCENSRDQNIQNNHENKHTVVCAYKVFFFPLCLTLSPFYLCALLLGMQIGAATVERRSDFPQKIKLKIESPVNPSPH